MSSQTGKIYDLIVPSLDDLKLKIHQDLLAAFETVECELVECPDLTQEPFFLSAKGISGGTMIADVGGFANLLPIANLDAKFDMADIVVNSNVSDMFVIGAGAGPFVEVGVNCEIVANAQFKNSKIHKNGSYLAKLDNGNNITFQSQSTKFALLGQFLCSEGKSGKILKVTAENRKLDGSIMSFIQKTLAKHYGHESNFVGLGGVILVQSGDVKIHVMPHFSECPLDTPEKVNEWLKFFPASAPFVAVGEMVSHDPLGLELRLEHFHGFTSDRKLAGHFHYDTTPEKVKYTCYFNVAEKLLRLCQPTK